MVTKEGRYRYLTTDAFPSLTSTGVETSRVRLTKRLMRAPTVCTPGGTGKKCSPLLCRYLPKGTSWTTPSIDTSTVNM